MSLKKGGGMQTNRPGVLRERKQARLHTNHGADGSNGNGLAVTTSQQHQHVFNDY
jgi:hypothetical protein